MEPDGQGPACSGKDELTPGSGAAAKLEQEEHQRTLRSLCEEIQGLREQCSDLTDQLARCQAVTCMEWSPATSGSGEEEHPAHGKRATSSDKGHKFKRGATGTGGGGGLDRMQMLEVALLFRDCQIEELHEQLRWQEIQHEVQLCGRDEKIRDLKSRIASAERLAQLKEQVRWLYSLTDGQAQARVADISARARFPGAFRGWNLGSQGSFLIGDQDATPPSSGTGLTTQTQYECSEDDGLSSLRTSIGGPLWSPVPCGTCRRDPGPTVEDESSFAIIPLAPGSGTGEEVARAQQGLEPARGPLLEGASSNRRWIEERSKIFRHRLEDIKRLDSALRCADLDEETALSVSSSREIGGSSTVSLWSCAAPSTSGSSIRSDGIKLVNRNLAQIEKLAKDALSCDDALPKNISPVDPMCRDHVQGSAEGRESSTA